MCSSDRAQARDVDMQICTSQLEKIGSAKPKRKKNSPTSLAVGRENIITIARPGTATVHILANLHRFSDGIRFEVLGRSKFDSVSVEGRKLNVLGFMEFHESATVIGRVDRGQPICGSTAAEPFESSQWLNFS